MLQLAGVGALILLLLGRKGAPTQQHQTVKASRVSSRGVNPTAGQPGGAQAYGALKQEYQTAAQKLGFGPNAPTDLPGPLMAEVVSAMRPGHSGDMNALAGQIARYYSNQANLPPATVRFLKAMAGMVPGVGPILKGIVTGADALSKVGGGKEGSLGQTSHAVAGSAAKQQAQELMSPKQKAAIEKAKEDAYNAQKSHTEAQTSKEHSRRFFSGSGVPKMTYNSSTGKFELG